MQDVLARRAARGIKRHCQDCERPFYDLSRTPIVCPDCGVEQAPVEAMPHYDPTVAPPARESKWRNTPRRPALVPNEAAAEVEVDKDDEAVVAEVDDVDDDETPAEGLVDEGFLEQESDDVVADVVVDDGSDPKDT